MNASIPLRLAFVVGVLAAASSAGSRNVGQMMPVAPALAAARASGETGDIEFGFGSVSSRGAEGVGGAVSVQGVGSHLAEPHGFRPTDDEACASALRDALKRLAEAARNAGGHAVVGIVSTYNGATIDDPTRVECRLGQYKALAPLSGVVARGVPAPAALPERARP
jgi:sugar phosphate isomerase/epimerase